MSEHRPIAPPPPDAVPVYSPYAKTSGMAISSLVLGIMSFIFWILTGMPAVILGALALVRINRSQGQLKGEGLAIAGIVTGGVTSMMIFPIMVALLLPAVQGAREAARRNASMNNLRQITIGLINHETATRRFPAPGGGQPGDPLVHPGSQLSWRVRILPYIDEEVLYSRFKLDEPWDSPHNLALLDQMPDVYRLLGDDPTSHKTQYLLVTGPGTAFPDATTQPTHQDFRDGTSRTLLIVEADEDAAVEWTKPGDYPFDPADPLANLGNQRIGVFLAAAADGRVHTIPITTPPEEIAAFMTNNGQEPVAIP